MEQNCSITDIISSKRINQVIQDDRKTINKCSNITILSYNIVKGFERYIILIISSSAKAIRSAFIILWLLMLINYSKKVRYRYLTYMGFLNNQNLPPGLACQSSTYRALQKFEYLGLLMH